MARQTVVAGNWKMNLDRKAATALAEAVAAQRSLVPGVELVLCPPSLYLGPVGNALQLTGDSSPSGVWLGAQNMHDEQHGAFTGEIAPPMLIDMGCRYVILGHSERRTLFHETDARVNKKTKAAHAIGLTPIVCVGETLEERERGQTQTVVTEQIQHSLNDISAEHLKATVIAYEPVWAIGAGKVATPDQAQEVHALIRSLVASMASPEVSQSVTIQYGGSVKPDNAGALASQPDIDGALVGGASLKADDFLGIAQAFNT